MTSPSEPEPAEDPRFNFGLMFDVHKVLEQHGFTPPADAQERHRAYGAAMSHLYRLVRAFEGHDETLGSSTPR
jgi:hypothetical protein